MSGLTPAQLKAQRKFAAVLDFPCTSGACTNVKGQLCTFADGRIRQKPHDQRIAAAIKAGAFSWRHRVPPATDNEPAKADLETPAA